MSSDRHRRKHLLWNPWFLATSLLGSVAMGLVAVFGSLTAQIAMLGVVVSMLAGVLFSLLERQAEQDKKHESFLQTLRIPQSLVDDPEIYRRYLRFADLLSHLCERNDATFRTIVLGKLLSIEHQLESLAEGKVEFVGTESWRAVYEELLQTKGLFKYRSAAWMKSPAYWQDASGKQSLEANFQAIDRGMLIERVVVLPDKLWQEKLPRDDVFAWIKKQSDLGVWVELVRESDLVGDKDLPLDFGIYGDRAVGIHELDADCQTIRFTLHFDADEVSLAEDRWRRLRIHAVSYQRLIDN